MRQHYRPEKVSFWNKLVRNMQEEVDKAAEETSSSSSTSSISCEDYSRNMWILVGLCVLLAVTLTVAVICVSRLHTRYRRLSTSGDGRPTPVRS